MLFKHGVKCPLAPTGPIVGDKLLVKRFHARPAFPRQKRRYCRITTLHIAVFRVKGVVDIENNKSHP